MHCTGRVIRSICTVHRCKPRDISKTIQAIFIHQFVGLLKDEKKHEQYFYTTLLTCKTLTKLECIECVQRVLRRRSCRPIGKFRCYKPSDISKTINGTSVIFIPSCRLLKSNKYIRTEFLYDFPNVRRVDKSINECVPPMNLTMHASHACAR